jgi:hypothetical protein
MITTAAISSTARIVRRPIRFIPHQLRSPDIRTRHPQGRFPEPSFSGIFAREHFEVVDVADFFAGVDVDQDFFIGPS